jgi:hypothetical protein
MPSTPRAAGKPNGGRNVGQKNKYSTAVIGRDILEALHTAMYFGTSPEKYFVKLRDKNPAMFAQFVLAAMKNADPSIGEGGLTINVVQLSSPIEPTAGVLSSVHAGHLAPQRHLQLVSAEIIENGDG